MNRYAKNGIIVVLFLLSLTTLFNCAGSSETENLYYSLEMDGRTFGYQKIGIARVEEDGVSLTLLKEESRSLSSALGADINTSTEAEYRFDFETGRLVSCDVRIDQENLEIRLSARLEGDRAHIFLTPGGGEKEVFVGPDVVFENPVFFRHVERDFLGQGIKTKRYKILDLLDREVQEVSYTYIGQEDVQCAGHSLDV